ncbi:MAG: hypothetical protein JO227_20520 [Acetobacteraceae bacterium]|nr:hypothetical protein [Acetobacteraceae bacterium]
MIRLKSCSVSLTPDHPMPLIPDGGGLRVHDRVDGELEAVFMLLSDGRDSVLIGSIDTLFLTERFSCDIRMALGSLGLPLFLFATHTHTAPSLSPDFPRLGQPDPEWYRCCVSSCARAIETLFGSRMAGEPVAVRYGEQRTRLNINRRRPAWVLDYPLLLRERRFVFEKRVALAANNRGFVDPRLRAVVMEDRNGSVRGIIWSLAAHPSRYPHIRHVSPDYPGLIRNALRRRLGQDCAVVYIPGLAGSAIPNFPWNLPPTAKDACLSLLPFFPVSLPVSAETYHAWVQRVLAVILQVCGNKKGLVNRPQISTAYANLAGVFHSRSTAADNLDLHIARLSLAGDLDILAFNGEMVCEWLPLLEPVTTGNVLFSGYLTGPAMYVPTSSQIPEGGYEVTGFQELFGVEGTFSPDITQRVVSAVDRLWTSGK